MPDIKEKSTKEKAKGGKGKLARELSQPMKERAARELRKQDPSHPETQEQTNAGSYATDRLEETAGQTAHYTGGAVREMLPPTTARRQRRHRPGAGKIHRCRKNY